MCLLAYRTAKPHPGHAPLPLRHLGLAPPGVAPTTLDEAGRVYGVTGSWIGHLERRTAAAVRRASPLLAAVELLSTGQPRSSAPRTRPLSRPRRD